MSTLKDDEPFLVLCCDKSTTKISENEELDSLRYQLKILKEQFDPQAGAQDEEKAKLLQENVHCKQRLEKMHHTLLEKEQALSTLQGVVEQFRYAGHTLRCELQKAQAKEKELSQKMQASCSISLALQEKVQKYEQEILQLQAAFEKEGQGKRVALEEAASLYLQFDILKKRVTQSEQALSSLKQTEGQIGELQAAKQLAEKMVLDYAAELKQLQDKTAKAEGEKKEAEEKLNYSHQHLVKKVREVTELTDRLETVEHLLEGALENKRETVEMNNRLQKQLEQYAKQQEQVERQLQAAQEAAHVVASESEEKYFKVYDALKKAEARNEELKIIEEKHQQLQQIWLNMNGCFHMPAQKEEKLGEAKRPYQNLFDIQHPANQAKSYLESAR